jgi:hypothetical protein
MADRGLRAGITPDTVGGSAGLVTTVLPQFRKPRNAETQPGAVKVRVEA